MNYCSLELFKKPITDEIFEDEKKYDKKNPVLVYQCSDRLRALKYRDFRTLEQRQYKNDSTEFR